MRSTHPPEILLYRAQFPIEKGQEDLTSRPVTNKEYFEQAFIFCILKQNYTSVNTLQKTRTLLRLEDLLVLLP